MKNLHYISHIWIRPNVYNNRIEHFSGRWQDADGDEVERAADGQLVITSTRDATLLQRNERACVDVAAVDEEKVADEGKN